MNVVKQLRRLTGMTQTELAKVGETSQPTIAAYESGAKSPNMRTVLRLAAASGYDMHVAFVPPMTREDRRSLALHRRIGDQLISDPADTLARARANLERMWELHPGARPLLEEWERMLDGPPEVIVDVLAHPGVRYRELRQVTPFAGVLNAVGRTAAYREFRRDEAGA